MDVWRLHTGDAHAAVPRARVEAPGCPGAQLRRALRHQRLPHARGQPGLRAALRRCRGVHASVGGLEALEALGAAVGRGVPAAPGVLPGLRGERTGRPVAGCCARGWRHVVPAPRPHSCRSCGSQGRRWLQSPLDRVHLPENRLVPPPGPDAVERHRAGGGLQRRVPGGPSRRFPEVHGLLARLREHRWRHPGVERERGEQVERACSLHAAFQGLAEAARGVR
mmetsp:Transcript_110424/g.319143  ORF Transcript_110424/g.319143 Transcript_110424/m.319143 type:complete len:223 (-) Transcript_110424:617-1285(-)